MDKFPPFSKKYSKDDLKNKVVFMGNIPNSIELSDEQIVHDLKARQTELETQNKFLQEALQKNNTTQTERFKTGYFRIREFSNRDQDFSSDSSLLPELRLEIASKPFCEIVGIDIVPKKGIDIDILKYIHPNDLYSFRKIHTSAVNNIDNFSWLGQILIKSDYVYLHVDTYPTIISPNEIIWSGTITIINQEILAPTDMFNIQDNNDIASDVHSYSFEELMNGANVGTLEWNIQTGKIKFNKIWANSLGYSTTELKIGILFYKDKGWKMITHPDDIESSTLLLEKHFTGELPHYCAEVRMKHRKGHWVWMRQEGKVKTWTDDGKPLIMYGTHTDITKQKQAEEELNNLNDNLEKRVAIRTAELEKLNAILEKSQQNFRTLTDFTYDWEYWKNTDDTIMFMTPSVERITGYTVEEFMEAPQLLDRIIFKSDKLLWESHKAERCRPALHENTVELVFRIVKKTGEIRWIGHICRCIFIDGKYLGVRVSNRDITEKVAADQALLDLTVKVEERERNRFSQELHDGMGPLLSTIKLYFEWLSDTDDESKRNLIKEKGGKCIEAAIQTARELSHGMSSQLLIKSGYISAIQQFVQQINETNKISLNFKTNTTIKFDYFLEIALYRITTELIKNTLSYASATSIEINFNYYPLLDTISFTYTDNGSGFNPDILEGDKKGLGIMNIQQRVQVLKGNIVIHSEPGNGMQVKIELPVENNKKTDENE